MSNTFDKLSVLDSFIEEVNSYLPEIETNLERLAQSPGDMDALEETYRRTHTIGGSASMMDFPGLAHVSYGMEDILNDALDGVTTLDESVLGLLRRSLGRLHQLLEGIRNGVDEDAIMRENDADFARYGVLVENGAHALPQEPVLSPGPEVFSQEMPAASALPSLEHSPSVTSALPSWEEAGPPTSSMPVLEVSPPVSPAIPSFDEVLASFRAPTVAPGEDIAWPEEAMPETRFEEERQQSLLEPQDSPWSLSPSPSALDALVASTRQIPSVQPPSSPSYEEAREPQVQSVEPVQDALPPLALDDTTRSRELVPVEHKALPQAYEDMQREAQTLEGHAASLKQFVEQLRAAAAVVEAQRSEFKGFLDGSKDALERMEEWAGRAMGLNLRNSPEQVRRYLPLSVMWVANSKLKKVLDVLGQVSGGVEVTDEQLSDVLQQLHSSIEACEQAFLDAQSQALPVLPQEAGWSPWDVQVDRHPETARERVTFERQGDLVSLRAEVEAQIREELRREYESRSAVQETQRELEQRIRQEVRQEYGARQALAASGMPDSAWLQELEQRLRSDIEIQVRQDFLQQLGTVSEDSGERRAAASSSSVSPSTYNPAGGAHTVASSVVPSTPLPGSSGSEKSAATDFGDEATEIFRLEAEEHLQTIGMQVAALEKDPTNLEYVQGVRRATHTLKGAAGMMGFRAIADLCHVSEDLLDSIMEGTTAISDAALSLVLDTAETLDLLISGLGGDTKGDEQRVQALRTRYAELLGVPNTPLSSPDEDLDEDLDGVDERHTDFGLVAGVVGEGSETPVETTAQRVGRGDLNVRVRLQRLDELVNLFGELLVNRSVLEERVQRLVRLVSEVGVSSNRLRDVGQKLESRFEAATLPSGRSVQVMPGEGNQSLLLAGNKRNGNGRDSVELSHLADFDELELDRYTEFHQLARGLSEGISDMATLSNEMDAVIRECESIFARENRLNTTFQDRLMKVRLVPLSTMAPRLYRAARAVALKQNKKFDFVLEGETTEVDRTVFEEIAGPLLHLVRNAVNHAIETPEVRAQKGKPPTGVIKLSAAYEGNQVVITVSEDGTGIDPEHVRRVAVARGLISAEQQLSENDLIELIFRPGFTTAEVLSEESGRGVGLDVVRDSVSRLRGTLEVDSMPGKGTAFTMKFPTSLAIQSAVMVRVGTQQFAIPTVMVETIGRLDSFKRSALAGQPAVLVRNDLYPLHFLAQYLSLPVGTIDDKAPLLIVNTGGHRVALVVDEVKEKFDIVMKNLGPHLRHVHGVAGGTVLGNGRVVLILELSELLAARSKLVTSMSSGSAAIRREVPVSSPAEPQARLKQSIDVPMTRQNAGAARSTVVASPTPERGKHILVVDDSPSVRRVVSNMLKQHGWEVQTARDGVEALEMISYETPAAVLLDIEMPRMDGYELTATVRAQEQYRTLPLVVLTSRAAAKHQQKAMQLGASAYVVKPYQDEELLNTLNSLVYGAVVRS